MDKLIPYIFENIAVNQANRLVKLMFFLPVPVT